MEWSEPSSARGRVVWSGLYKWWGYENSARSRVARATNRAFSAAERGARFVEIVIGVIAFINNSFCGVLVTVVLFSRITGPLALCDNKFHVPTVKHCLPLRALSLALSIRT